MYNKKGVIGIKEKKEYNIKKLSFSELNAKLIIFFLFLVSLTSLISIYFFYLMIKSTTTIVLPNTIEITKTMILIILIIAIETIIISFYVSRFISKPIIEINKAIKEIEKGNYNVNLDITTGDEIEKLSNSINQTTLALRTIEEERNELDSVKAEFLSMTSHELRSPMTPMKAQLQMLEGGYFGELSKKQKESISIITRNVDRLDNLICDFLEISRIEAAKLRFNFRETNVAQTLRETVKFMEGFAKEKNIKLKIDVGKIPSIQADPDRISQVLSNLINNAIKFSNKNSIIIVSAHNKGDFILFYVQDSGCGLTPEDKLRVFEPFYQVENINLRHPGGTGLGLTICRGIVESQKGKIWVESEIDYGSKFYFTIPLKPIRETEPVKLLFFKKNIDKKVKEKFETFLGASGVREIEEFKLKNKLKKENLFNYVESLLYKEILNKELSKISNKNIAKIFRVVLETIKNKKKVVKPKSAKFEDEWSKHEIDSVFIFDENANILDCNDNMLKRLGYTKSEILSLNLIDIDALDSKKDIINKINRIKKEGKISLKTMYKRKNGSAIFVYENLQYNRDKNQFKGIAREDFLFEIASK